MWSKDDVAAMYNLLCAILGIGALGMAHHWAAAGPIYGFMSICLMCLVNIYASVILSRCLLKVPQIQTFSDLGYYLMGNAGRSLVIVSQITACLCISVAFLILGGAMLLPGIFKGVFPTIKPSVWICIMALTLLPVVLVRTIKEAAWAIGVGAAGGILSIFVAIAASLSELPFDYRSSDVKFENVVTVFGGMSLAYGLALIIPTTQREHPKPERIPVIIIAASIISSIVYVAIAILGYIQFGCTAPGNLLESIRSQSWQIVAFGLMQLHVCIAYALVLNPALFLLERTVMGFAKPSQEQNRDLEMKGGDAFMSKNYTRTQTPSTKDQVSTSVNHGDLCTSDEVALQPYTSKQKLQSYFLRTTIVGVEVLVAILLQSCFMDVADFIGATSVTISCIILPCIFYLKMFQGQLPKWEKVVSWVIIVISLLLGSFTAYKKLVKIIDTASSYTLFEAVPPAPSNSSDLIHTLCFPGQQYK